MFDLNIEHKLGLVELLILPLSSVTKIESSFRSSFDLILKLGHPYGLSFHLGGSTVSQLSS